MGTDNTMMADICHAMDKKIYHATLFSKFPWYSFIIYEIVNVNVNKILQNQEEQNSFKEQKIPAWQTDLTFQLLFKDHLRPATAIRSNNKTLIVFALL